MRHRHSGILVILAFIAAFARCGLAQNPDYDQQPINYSRAAVSDPIARLQKHLIAGKAELKKQDEQGYLGSVLRGLEIPISSQVLVFSKTSLQREVIGPKTPRAIYFDDDTYIGYCQGGEVLEVATTDPSIGTVFYTLDQHPGKKQPRFLRQTDNCTQCHAGSMTRDIPGLIMRSVFADPRGNPILSAGTKLVNHETPFGDRFGGWYVTGKHGDYDAQHHLGNLIGKDRDDPDPVDPKAGANLIDLSKLFDTTAYLSPQSDLVAMMVLSHQVDGHNLINRANYACKYAIRDARVMNEALGQPVDQLSDSAIRRIEHPAEGLLKYMLFCDEAPLASCISGSTSYAKDFAARGPFDKKGRSLRDFDLQKRLFKYPLSYLIYSASFNGLPEQTKAYIYRRLFDILTGKVQEKAFAHFSADERLAILEILRDTKADLPAYWKAE